jgi:hypothetical protein
MCGSNIGNCRHQFSTPFPVFLPLPLSPFTLCLSSLGLVSALRCTPYPGCTLHLPTPHLCSLGSGQYTLLCSLFRLCSLPTNTSAVWVRPVHSVVLPVPAIPLANLINTYSLELGQCTPLRSLFWLYSICQLFYSLELGQCTPLCSLFRLYLPLANTSTI